MLIFVYYKLLSECCEVTICKLFNSFKIFLEIHSWLKRVRKKPISKRTVHLRINAIANNGTKVSVKFQIENV